MEFPHVQSHRDMVLKLADTLREMFFSSPVGPMKGQRFTVGQIRQAVLKNMNDGMICFCTLLSLPNIQRLITFVINCIGQTTSGFGATVSVSEVEGAVRELETEDLVQYLEKTQTVIIRG